MIPFSPVPEPEDFDADCRKKGQQWWTRKMVAVFTGGRVPKSSEYPGYWKAFRNDLRRGFLGLCGYCAMHVPSGLEQVEHFVGVQEDPSLAYEWSNYRCAQSLMNQIKGHRRSGEPQVLDPYNVKDGWFEILLPSLQLVLTDKIPCSIRPQAEFTLRRLKLRDDERLIRQRREWLAMYESGELTLQGLDKKAPLIAQAVRKRDGIA